MKKIYRPLFKNESIITRGIYPGVDNFNFEMDTILIRKTRSLFVHGWGWDSGMLSEAMTDHAKASLKYFGANEDYVRHILSTELTLLKLAVERWHPLFP